MLKADLWSRSVPQVDHRARDARLRLERLERLLVPGDAVANPWMRKAFYLFSLGIYGARSLGGRSEGPLSNRRPRRMPKIHEDWIGMNGSCCG